MKHFEPLRTYLSPLLLGARAHARDVGAGVGLGQAEGGQRGPLDELAEVLGLDLLGAAERDRRGGEAVGPERRADARAAPGDLLLDETAVEVGEAGTAVLLGDVTFMRPTSWAFSMIACGQIESLSYSQATGRISLTAKSCASSRSAFCSSVSVKSTMVSPCQAIDWSVNLMSGEGYPPCGARVNRYPSRDRGGAREFARECSGMQDAFGIVLVVVVVLAAIVAIGTLVRLGRAYDQIGRGGMSLRDGSDRPAGETTAGDGRRRARRGDPPDARGAQRAAPPPGPASRSTWRPRWPRWRAPRSTRGWRARSAIWSSRATRGARARARSRSTSRPRCERRLRDLADG